MNLDIIEELNKLLTNTMGYREVLLQLSDKVENREVQKKLKEFAEMAEEETNKLIQLIGDLGGDVETTGRHTDDAAISWVQKPLPPFDNLKSVLECLIKAQRQKEEDYNTILAKDEMDRANKNQLDKQRREAETQLLFFQDKLISLENKVP